MVRHDGNRAVKRKRVSGRKRRKEKLAPNIYRVLAADGCNNAVTIGDRHASLVVDKSQNPSRKHRTPCRLADVRFDLFSCTYYIIIIVVVITFSVKRKVLLYDGVFFFLRYVFINHFFFPEL